MRAFVSVTAALLGLVAFSTAGVRAQDVPGVDAIPVLSPEDPTPGDGLTADEIYRRLLENRFMSSDQSLAIVSGDRAGREQKIRMRMLWRRYPEGSEEVEEGILSRTLVRYMAPPEMRRTGYLIINKRDAPNDQFIYLHSMRRVRRVNLKSETVAGTDLSMEDIVPREMDDATYTRISDEEVEGTPCFVVQATPKPAAESQYSKYRLTRSDPLLFRMVTPRICV